MKICNICHKISATDKDHTDCIQKRSIEIEDQDFKNSIAEKLNLSKNNQDLGIEVKAILEHLTRDKDQKMNYNHFDNLSFSKSNFLERLSFVDSVRLVEGLEFVNISTSIIEAVSLPDSKNIHLYHQIWQMFLLIQVLK